MVTMLRENSNRTGSFVSRRAAIRAESASDESKSIQAVLSTEQPVAMFDYREWEAIDEILLASGRSTAEHVVLLDSHNRASISKVLGHIENVRTAEGGTDTEGVLHFDMHDDAAVKAFQKYRDKHVRDVSVGYTVLAYITVEPNATVTLEGRTFTAGKRRLRIATSWRIDEVSCVPIGADNQAKARASESQSLTLEVSEDEITSLLTQERSQQPSVETVSAETTPTAGNGNSERKAAMSATAQTEAGESRQKSEDELMKIGAQREVKRRSEIKELGEGVRAEALSKALDDPECTVDQARALFLKDLQEQRSATPAGSDAPQIIPAGNRRERDTTEHALAIALAKRMGANVEGVGHRMRFDSVTGEMLFERPDFRSKGAQEEWDRNLERADRFRGIHSVDLCRQALQIAKIEEPIERRALVTRAFSTPTVTTIYSTAMGAVLLSALGDMTDSTQGWTKEMDAKSFKKQELHRLEGGALKRRNRGKTADMASFADTMESYRVYEFARTLIIDRQDAIDDELGAWNTAMEAFALAILSLRPDIVYGLLAANAALETDNTALFHTDHANLLTTSALAAGTLQTALSRLGSQRGAGGLNLNLRDAALITGVGLSFTADQLANSSELRDSAAANGTLNPLKKRNILTQSDSRINAGFTDPVTETAVAAAATTWYVAAKGGQYGVCVGYLEGTNRMPAMKTTVLNSEGKYGIALDVTHTIGSGVSGYQGLVKGIN